jgi:hypothetical protein
MLGPKVERMIDLVCLVSSTDIAGMFSNVVVAMSCDVCSGVLYKWRVQVVCTGCCHVVLIVLGRLDGLVPALLLIATSGSRDLMSKSTYDDHASKPMTMSSLSHHPLDASAGKREQSRREQKPSS